MVHRLAKLHNIAFAWMLQKHYDAYNTTRSKPVNHIELKSATSCKQRAIARAASATI
jgi:hypothetical protein